MYTKRLNLAIIILIIAAIAPLSFGQAIDATILQVDFVNQDPDPAQPGDVVEVRFKIQNNGRQTTDDVIEATCRVHRTRGTIGNAIQAQVNFVGARRTPAHKLAALGALRLAPTASRADQNPGTARR